jgi:hypothetical protein
MAFNYGQQFSQGMTQGISLAQNMKQMEMKQQQLDMQQQQYNFTMKQAKKKQAVSDQEAWAEGFRSQGNYDLAIHDINSGNSEFNREAIKADFLRSGLMTDPNQNFSLYEENGKVMARVTNPDGTTAFAGGDRTKVGNFDKYLSRGSIRVDAKYDKLDREQHQQDLANSFRVAGLVQTADNQEATRQYRADTLEETKQYHEEQSRLKEQKNILDYEAKNRRTEKMGNLYGTTSAIQEQDRIDAGVENIDFLNDNKFEDVMSLPLEDRSDLISTAGKLAIRSKSKTKLKVAARDDFTERANTIRLGDEITENLNIKDINLDRGAMDATIMKIKGLMSNENFKDMPKEEFLQYVNSVGFKTDMGAFLASYIKSISGTAVTTSEFNRLRDLLGGSEWENETSAKAKMTRFMRKIKKDSNKHLRNNYRADPEFIMGQTMYDVDKKAETNATGGEVNTSNPEVSRVMNNWGGK